MNATGMPLVTDQPLSGVIGLMTSVLGGCLSIFRSDRCAAVSIVCLAPSLLQNLRV
jgi:hypothetical protein